jgi:hypothetical protein
MRTDPRSERGSGLIEATFAAGLLLVVMTGLLTMVGLAVMYTENHGHLEARTIEYAQDKMEQLLALAYTDEVSDTTFFPAAPVGGTGLAVGGSVDTDAPADGYVDWLAYDGTLLNGGVVPPANWFYQRVWEIAEPAGVNTWKQIRVVATVRSAIGGVQVPRSTLIVLKAAQF